MSVVSQHCEQLCSAQLAELKDPSTACQLAKGRTANIYSDSAYAHGVCHLLLSKQRGFRKSDGIPIQHAEQIGQLISAMMHLKRSASVKHTKKLMTCSLRVTMLQIWKNKKPQVVR